MPTLLRAEGDKNVHCKIVIHRGAWRPNTFSTSAILNFYHSPSCAIMTTVFAAMTYVCNQQAWRVNSNIVRRTRYIHGFGRSRRAVANIASNPTLDWIGAAVHVVMAESSTANNSRNLGSYVSGDDWFRMKCGDTAISSYSLAKSVDWISVDNNFGIMPSIAIAWKSGDTYSLYYHLAECTMEQSAKSQDTYAAIEF